MVIAATPSGTATDAAFECVFQPPIARRRSAMIIAIRHPRPAIDAGICYGQLDLPLAEPVEDAARLLKGRLGSHGFARIVTSPLQRALGLAEAIARDSALALTVDPRLQEMNFGTWEGVAWQTIPRAELDAWAGDPIGYRPGGGETVGELAERVSQAWQEAVAASERQLWITHAGPMRCLFAATRHLPLEQCLDRRFDFGEVLDLAAPA